MNNTILIGCNLSLWLTIINSSIVIIETWTRKANIEYETELTRRITESKSEGVRSIGLPKWINWKDEDPSTLGITGRWMVVMDRNLSRKI